MPGTKNVSLLETDKRTSKVPSRWCVTLAPEHTRQLLVLFLHNSPHKLDFKKVESQLLLAMITNSAVQSSTRTPIYRPQQSCKGCFYRHLSVHMGRGCLLPQCMLEYHVPPRADTPPGSRHPPSQEQIPLRWSRHPPEQTPPLPGETATAADGTHPTGMHSCYNVILFIDTPTMLDTVKLIAHCDATFGDNC